MAATAASDVSDGPVLNFINKRLRALKKKQNRILQMEEAIAQGKILNKEQEDVLRSKPSVTASIDELEKLRQPLSVAVADEISLALQRHQVSASPPVESTVTEDDKETEVEQKITDVEHQSDHGNTVVEDLLNLLYFGTMFDVRTASDFTSTILTRTHERGCCLTYDYVTDDESTDMLGERDLDLISTLGGLLVSRPVDSNLSHKNALRRCMEHAKLWLANSDQPIDPDSNITYAALRARLNKIMASDYFTTTPEMKAAVEVAAAAGNYALHGSMVPVNVPVQVEGSDVEYQQKDEDTANFQENESYDDQSSPVEEFHKSESEVENHAEVSAQTEPVKSQEEMGQNQREVETKEQNHVPRRAYQNQRGGRGGGGGGRRGYSNGRGGRYGGRGGGPYQNGRSQYYDQPGNYYPRNYAYNRGRGGRGGGGGGGGNSNYNHGSGGQAGNDPADS